MIQAALQSAVSEVNAGILPGQLGFSLLMAGVFGSSFLLYILRRTFVLRRIHATPITPLFFLLGEMTSRLLFQILCFIVITALGYYGFHFTLVNGFFTFLEMLLLSVPGLVIFTSITFPARMGRTDLTLLCIESGSVYHLIEIVLSLAPARSSM